MNRFFSLVIMCFLVLPTFAIDKLTSDIPSLDENIIETTSDDTEVNGEYSKDVTSVAPYDDSKFKKPYSKKKLAKRFIIGMLCVVGCSIFLYGTLSLYNKIRDGILSSTQSLSDNENSLDTPNDLTGSVKAFINKTHWDN